MAEATENAINAESGIDWETISEKLKALDKSLSRCGDSDIDIREITIEQTQKYLESRKLTSVDMVKCYLQRIKEMDFYLHSVIEVNGEALTLAARADEERSAGRVRGMLHGVPILIKDNIGTGDGMQTTAGAKALEWVKPKKDAVIVTSLRDAGAIILGKANMSEWANFRDEEMANGWSGRGGQTRSAYNLTKDPLGSSSGPAVAISTNFAVVALGSETDGSIICPASLASLVGLKPTLGTVSGKGVIPLAHSQDVVGPMARTTSDAAILLSVISNLEISWSGKLGDDVKNQKFRVGVLRDPYWKGVEEDLLEKLNDSLEALESSGNVDVVDPVEEISSYEIGHPHVFKILQYEFKHGVNKYLQNSVEHLEKPHFNREIKCVGDVIKFNEENPSSYGQGILLKANESKGLQCPGYSCAHREHRKQPQTYLDEMFIKYDVDAIATPYAEMSLYSAAARAGYPSITIPIGVGKDGMPFAMVLVGKCFADSTLLKIGYILETQMKNEGRSMPNFVY